MLLSIDIGSTNFGWCRWSPAKQFYDFGVLNLKTVKGKDLPEKMHTLYKDGFFEADIILCERQMRAKFKCCATAIRCLGTNFEKTHIVAPQSVKRHFQTRKLTHRENKKAHMELAQTFLEPKHIQRLLTFKKRDDICDAVVQAQYWVEKHSLAVVNLTND